MLWLLYWHQGWWMYHVTDHFPFPDCINFSKLIIILKLRTEMTILQYVGSLGWRRIIKDIFQSLHHSDSFTVWDTIPDPPTSNRIRGRCWSKGRWLINISMAFVPIPVQNNPVGARMRPAITWLWQGKCTMTSNQGNGNRANRTT